MIKPLALLTFAVAAAAQTPTIAAGGVVNAASFTPQLCPGAVAAVFGTNFGTNAANVTVSVAGKPAYVIAVTASQLTVQIPFETAAGATTLTVTVNGIASAPYSLMLATYAPAIVSQGGAGTGPGDIAELSGALVTTAAPAKPGDTLVVYASGLGPTNPATPTGPPTALASTAATATLTVGGAAAKVTFAGVAPGLGGLYQINFTVPTGVQGTQPLVLSIGGVSSNSSVTLPVVGVTSLVSNARNYNGGNTTFAAPGTAAPGSIATIFANGLPSSTQTTGFPSTTFQGVQVTFNGTPAPIFHLVAPSATQSGQIDLYVPEELAASGTVNVQLTTPTGLYPNYTLNMTPAFPGLYRIADPSVSTRFNVIAQFANTAWLALPVSTTTALKLPACTTALSPLSLCGRPATIGDYLVLWVTGLGITTPNGAANGTPLPTGSIPPVDGSVLYETPTKPTVTVGGIPVTILYCGLAPGFPGDYQIDFQLPSGVVSGDDIPVVVTMGSVSDTATISIQPRTN